ncbi:MAG: CapA family protein [Eubacterium sp.]|nr:CapA family protein [Eubacterium sp.]
MDAVSLANNHVADFGRDGVRNMIELLQEYDVEYAGAGANRDDAGTYRLLEADGLTVGFVACTEVLPNHFAATNDDYGVCSTGYPNLYENVLEASLYSDFVVVYVHWGNEYDLRITESQREIAQRLIDCGADIVIGSHPHILQEVEQYKNGIIFYSLGNYIFDQALRQSRNTIMLQLNANKTTGEGYFTLIPMRINNFHPYETKNRFYISEIHQSLLKELPIKAYTVLENGRIQIPIKLFTPGDKKVQQVSGSDFSENRILND